MSYLSGPALKSFQKAVISFWFKVPQASLDVAQNEFDDFYAADNPGDPPPLLGLVPLVVFGKEGTSRTTSETHNTSEPLTTSTAVHTCVEHASDALDGDAAVAGTTYTMTYWAECNDRTDERTYYKDTITYSAIPGKPKNPSFIAIDGGGNLQINFESTQKGDVTFAYDITGDTSAYYTQETVKECWTFNNLPGCGDFQDVVVSDGGLAGALEIVFAELGFRLNTAVADKYVDEGSSPRVDHPATWTYGPIPEDVGTGAISFSPPANCAADTWNHVLVSVDMTDGSASTGFAVGENFADGVKRISKTATLYVAVDDKNYKTGGNFFPDTNKVVTGSAVIIAFMSQAHDNSDPSGQTGIGPVPSYSLTNMSVPAAEVGIPSVEKYVDKIRRAEMAEFQMWLGQTIDTSVEYNRRAFIDYKRDAKGAPIPDKNGKLTLVPVNPTKAAKLIGREPDVELHKSGNWIKGRNTGSTGTGPDGKPIRGGQFTPTGVIKKYKPDPSIVVT